LRVSGVHDLRSLGAKPGPTFDEPFEMLTACHDRANRTLALLARLREHVLQHGADDQARQAARDVMRYFDQAAPQHHHDEELHVFPPLLALGDAAVAGAVRRLQQDHQQMEARWPDARQVLAALAEGRLQQIDASGAQALDAFASLYGDHIVTEDTLVYPAAQGVLDAGAQAAMGREMKQRRGG
jgi:hemerythrin-like domain-containing protein